MARNDLTIIIDRNSARNDLVHRKKKVKGEAVKNQRFYRIHSVQEALYQGILRLNPIIIDDEEVLVKLFAFNATLTPQFTS